MFVIAGNVVTTVVDIGVITSEFGLFNPLFGLATFLPGIFVATRRLHDLDKSGWWQLIGLVPILGWILLIYWFAQPGQDEENRFGANPMT